MADEQSERRSTSPTCTVCQHRLRDDIDLALLAGESKQKLEKRFGVGRMSIGRHERAHLPSRIADDAERLGVDADGSPNLWSKLSEIERNLEQTRRAAPAISDFLRADNGPNR